MKFCSHDRGLHGRNVSTCVAEMWEPTSVFCRRSRSMRENDWGSRVFIQTALLIVTGTLAHPCVCVCNVTYTIHSFFSGVCFYLIVSFHKSLYIKHFIWVLSRSSQSKYGILVIVTCMTKYCCDYYCCSSHRSIFSRESMRPSSDSATHRPISRRSVLIPYFSKELFFSSPFSLSAFTGLFSLANQCPRQAIWPHTDQSVGRAHWFQLPLKNYFF